MQKLSRRNRPRIMRRFLYLDYPFLRADGAGWPTFPCFGRWWRIDEDRV